MLLYEIPNGFIDPRSIATMFTALEASLVRIVVAHIKSIGTDVV
jgi:hypothetical protein